MREQELILYRDFAKEDILQDMAWLMAHYQEGDAVDRDPAALLYDCMHRLLAPTVFTVISGTAICPICWPTVRTATAWHVKWWEAWQGPSTKRPSMTLKL